MENESSKPGRGGTDAATMTTPARSARPTLKTISGISGLAVPTVSRALNDAPDISAETKRLVRRIATEIGYVPDRAGRRLRTGKTNVISLVLSTDHDVMNYTARMISSIAAALRHTPYHLIVTPYFPDEDPLKPVKYITETRSADGIIINQIQPEDPRVEHLMKTGFPFVTHGRSIWADRHAYFDFDNRAFGEICVRRLASLGRKRLMLIAPPLGQTYSIDMREGVQEEAAKLGVEASVLHLGHSDMAPEDLERLVREEIRDDPLIDGFICPSASSAMTTVAAADSLGHDIGTDYDLIAKEGLSFLRRFRREIIVVGEDVARAGNFMARTLLHAIENPDDPLRHHLDVPTD